MPLKILIILKVFFVSQKVQTFSPANDSKLNSAVIHMGPDLFEGDPSLLFDLWPRKQTQRHFMHIKTSAHDRKVIANKEIEYFGAVIFASFENY